MLSSIFNIRRQRTSARLFAAEPIAAIYWADNLAPDLGNRPYKATAALAPPVQLSSNPNLLEASLTRDAEGYFCLKNQT